MAETKYGKYILKEPLEKGVFAPAMMLSGEKHFGGLPLSIALSSYSESFDVYQDSHKHEFDQFLWFIGGDPMNFGDLGAEIEFCLGEEREKHIINTASIVYIPKGMYHCPLNYKIVNKPFVVMDAFLSPTYEQRKESQ